MLVVLLGWSHPYYITVHLNEEIFKIVRIASPYYQYHPIRVIFCAFFVWYALKFCRRDNRFYYGLGMFLAALSAFWNFDSGLALICAWLGFLAYRDIARRSGPFAGTMARAGRHVIFMILCLGLLALAYSVLAYLQSHRFPAWADFLAFHKLFISQGFFMRAMNPFHFWHLQVWVYMAVLVASLLKLRRKESTDRDAYLFFLAVLGLFLFRYYVGRSAIFNLYPGSYPLVFILALSLQDLSGRYQQAVHKTYDILKITACLMLANYGLVVFAYHSQDLLYHAGQKWQLLAKSGSNEVEPAAAYINQTKKSDEVFIFSSLAEYMHIQTSTYSPLPYSCLNEVFTEEQGQQINGLLERKEIKQVYFILKRKVVKEKGFSYLANFVVPTIDRYYRREKTMLLNKDLAVVLFEPK
jgi:hypothetical protein